jgi:uncharacterized protein YbaP (TraB family)
MRQAIAKRTAALLRIVLLIGLCGLPNARAAAFPAFEITRSGEVVGYLVGTMHSEDPRVLAVLDDLAPLVADVDVVAIELVPDGATLLAVGAATLLPAGEVLSEWLGPQRFSALREVADQRGLPLALLERLKPWAAAVMLAVPPMEGGEVLDTALFLSAQAAARQVVGLETAAEQVQVFDAMPVELQIALLDAVIKNAELLPMQIAELTVAFLSGDLAKIDRVARSQYAGMSSALQAWFERELLQRRNERMLTRALPLFAQQRVLIAVGAMHLGGDVGLVAGLRQRGFAVTELRDQ